MSIVTVDKTYYTVDPLYQWDKNQVLEVRGLSLPFIPEIHYSNAGMDKAIVRQATVDAAGVITADVPNSLLQSASKITACICGYEGETFKTLYIISIPVTARSKPADYVIESTDSEVYSFNKLENQIANLVSAMSDEDATGNYEIVDMRIGADGTVYTSAGEAVRSQIQSLSDKYNALDGRVTETEGNITDLDGRVTEISSAVKKDIALNLSDYNIAVGTVHTNSGIFLAGTNRIVNKTLIPVKAGETVYVTGDYVFNVFLFDTLENYVSKGVYGYTTYTFNEDGFVRFALGFTDNRDTAEYLDDVVNNFIYYKSELIVDDVITLKEKVEELTEEIENIDVSQKKHVYNFSYDLDKLSISEYTDFEDLRNYTPSQIHAALQQLCDNAVGYASYTHLGNDTEGNALYKYVLEPNTPFINCARNENTGRTFDGTKIDTPTIIIISGIHGSEHSDDYALYHFFKNILTNRNDPLNFMFRNIRFVIVPCCCPSGLIANTYTNSNGVNLNRNFGVTADSIPTELESQYIKNVIDEYSNAICMIDMHTHYTYDVMSWNYTDDEVFKYIATRTMSDLTFAWIDKYPDVEFDTVNGQHDPYTKTWVYNAPNVDTTSSTYAYKVHGIPAGTIETRRALPITGTEVRHGTDAVAFTYDALVNFILAFCRTLK